MPNPSTCNPRRLAVAENCGECVFWRDRSPDDGRKMGTCPTTRTHKHANRPGCPHFNQVSGLHWEPHTPNNPRYDRDRGMDCTIWLLVSYDTEVGLVRRYDWEQANWHAFVPWNQYSVHNCGSLADCARALVSKVRDRG